MGDAVMGLYRRYILPRVIHLACGTEPAMRQRAKVIPSARRRVLEVGIGSGLNLGFYDPAKVESVHGLDPAPEMLRMAEEAAAGTAVDVELVPGGGEEIPFDDRIFDTVVMTYTLCTIADPVRAVREIARVLAPGGRLLFCEHGLAPDESVRRWQRRANPLWRRIGGGCNLDRDIPSLLREGGLQVASLDTMYLPGWRAATFNYWGEATSGPA
jgi:ubiquinone/menaquinone biosynthesis C-methylase UbiE